MGDSAINGMAAAKIKRVTAVTTFRLPRSPAMATGRPQAICATAATKPTAPRPARLKWNVRWTLGPSTAIPLLTMPGTNAAAVMKTSGA